MNNNSSTHDLVDFVKKVNEDYYTDKTALQIQCISEDYRIEYYEGIDLDTVYYYGIR